jgi:hypothetical protein
VASNVAGAVLQAIPPPARSGKFHPPPNTPETVFDIALVVHRLHFQGTPTLLWEPLAAASQNLGDLCRRLLTASAGDF